MPKQRPNDQRSNVKNPNNYDFKKANDNHSNMHNPKTSQYDPEHIKNCKK